MAESQSCIKIDTGKVGPGISSQPLSGALATRTVLT